MFRFVLCLFGLFFIFFTTGFFAFIAFVIAPFSTPDTEISPRLATLAGGVVFSGDVHRIDKGFALLDQHKIQKLLISGVRPHVRIEHIAARHLSFSARDAHTIACCIALGKRASNTIENAKETEEWAKKVDIDILALITSDYHMPRSRVIFFLTNSLLEIHPVAVKSMNTDRIFTTQNVAFVAKTWREYIKTLFTILWLLPAYVDHKISKIYT